MLRILSLSIQKIVPAKKTKFCFGCLLGEKLARKINKRNIEAKLGYRFNIAISLRQSPYC
ncbi:hypothetical protein D3C87_218080 [compost metagenome]